MLTGTDASRRTTEASKPSSKYVGLPGSRLVLGVLTRRLHSMAREDGGVAAVEFAILLPLLILFYAGVGELSEAVMTSRKVVLLSRTLVDLGSQQPTYAQATSTPTPPNAISQSTLTAIFDGSKAIMAPGSSVPLKMTLSAVDIVNNPSGQCCTIRVRWTYTQAGSLRPCQTPLMPADPQQAPSPTTISSALVPTVTSLPSPISLLIADVSYAYQGPFSSPWIDFSSGMSRTSYMYPRSTGQVILQGPLSQTGSQNGTICY